MNVHEFINLVITKHGSDTAENRLKETFFVIEATSFEQYSLWSNYAPNSRHRIFNNVSSWEEISSGWGIQVGELDNRPCMISVNWAIINERPVMFYYQCSQVTDSLQTEKWLAENFNGTYEDDRRAQTDASNFGHFFAAT